MGVLKNTFSWSFSAANDFEKCQRKRYWNKYGKWGGWDRNADPIQKKAYQLDKIDNLYSILGNAVEMAAMHILRLHQNGQTCSAEDAYNQVAKDYLNKSWIESKKMQWKTNPKKYCCLHEHYYNTISKDKEEEITANMVARTKKCLSNFHDKTLPRIANITPEMEIAVDVPGRQSDAEHFLYEGIKIYAIPDYCYRKDHVIHIHDWKSGRQRDSHRDQLAVYGLWAACKHQRPDESLCVYVEYLKDGEVVVASLTPEDLERVKERIGQSVADMTEMLVDADRERNKPLPKKDWELALDTTTCRHCNFFELCEGELKEVGLI